MVGDSLVSLSIIFQEDHMRGMVVGEGGRSSGVLLYHLFGLHNTIITIVIYVCVSWHGSGICVGEMMATKITLIRRFLSYISSRTRRSLTTKEIMTDLIRVFTV